ncbi:alpha/beta-hydrolase [Calocera viscosa TUFC12733]|uniref:Alpha/beta-hydrolase n=1 Tax=Calocera viscosa (strain TUFC12733) TaxID=1330018 RepID=A0A167JT89_CALVF|nr:alpha/beta-hydrolase [Calocera viscosa TUFC12733]
MSPTWSTAHLGVLVPGDAPIHLHYFDNSPSTPSAPYTTVILVHGNGFNSHIWVPSLPHLPPNTRVLAFNRRGYTGSSPPHASTQQLPGNVEAFGRYVVDLLGFLKYAVEVLGVHPAPSEGQGKKGGIVLVGWSKGCASVISLLSHLPPSPVLSPHPLPRPAPLDSYLPLLHSHLRATIFFEPPQMIFGLPGPAEYPQLAGVPPERLPQAFGEVLLETIPEDKRQAVLAAEDAGGAADIVTWNGATSDERRDVCERAFPSNLVRVGTLYCEGTTLAPVVNGVKWINNRYAALGVGVSAEFVKGMVEGGNHFVMATDPDSFGTALGEVLVQLGVE